MQLPVWNLSATLAFVASLAILATACGSKDSPAPAPITVADTALSPVAESSPPSPDSAPLAPSQPTAEASPEAGPPLEPSPTAAPAARPAAPSGRSVSMVDFGYAPSLINATAGQTITLTVIDAGVFPHTFTIDGIVDSGTVQPGQRTTVTFAPTRAGTLSFYCTLHGVAAMSGRIAVAGPSGSLLPLHITEEAVASSRPARTS